MNKYIPIPVGLFIIFLGFINFGPGSSGGMYPDDGIYFYEPLCLLALGSGTLSFYKAYKGSKTLYCVSLIFTSLVIMSCMTMIMYFSAWPTWDTTVAKIMMTTVGIFPLSFIFGMLILLSIPIQIIQFLILLQKEFNNLPFIEEAIFSFSGLCLSFWIMKNAHIFMSA